MISVLRIGHRQKRDERLSTHCGLIARALGANEMIFSGEKDRGLIESLEKVSDKWGGTLKASYEKNWKSAVKEYRNKKFSIVHLTMFGMPLSKKIQEIRKKKRILVIIGSEKVPGEVYGLSDFNIAIGNQPHSEAAALAIFMHEYFQGKELEKRFPNAKISIVPQEKGKKARSTLKR